MKRSDTIETAAILLLSSFTALIRGRLPTKLDTGYIALFLGLVFLLQTLVRDLWLLYRQRGTNINDMPGASCVCLESGIGFVPVFVAAVLIGGHYGLDIPLPSWFWPAAVPVVLTSGFFLKDYVISLNPLRIRRDPDHVNFRFALRRTFRSV